MIAPRMRAIAIRLELDLAVGIEAVDRADQAEQPVRDEVAVVDVRGQPDAEPAGDVLDERRVAEDQLVAERPVPRLPVLAPKAERVAVDGHGRRIRRYLSILLSADHAIGPIHSARAAPATAITHWSARKAATPITTNSSVSAEKSSAGPILPTQGSCREPRLESSG